MTKDKALKMAIEALKTADAIVTEYSGVELESIQPAINACKETLEQQEIGDAEIKQMLDDIEYYQKRVKELEQLLQDYVLICKRCGDDIGIVMDNM